MSFIANKRTLTKVAEKYYKHRAEWALNLDPFNNDVDIIDCNPNGIHGITYIEPIDAVTFFYTDESEGVKNIKVFCDVKTAADLDVALDLIQEFPDISMDEWFMDAFCICWDYACPDVYKLIKI